MNNTTNSWEKEKEVKEVEKVSGCAVCGRPEKGHEEQFSTGQEGDLSAHPFIPIASSIDSVEWEKDFDELYGEGDPTNTFNDHDDFLNVKDFIRTLLHDTEIAAREYDGFDEMVRDFTSHGFMAKSEARRRFNTIIEQARKAEREEIKKEIENHWKRMLLVFDGKLPYVYFGGKADEKEKITIFESGINEALKVLSLRNNEATGN